MLHFENEINRTEQNRTERILRQDHVFPIIPCFLKSIITSVKGAKQIYNIFIRNTDLPACQVNGVMFLKSINLNGDIYIAGFLQHAVIHTYNDCN